MLISLKHLKILKEKKLHWKYKWMLTNLEMYYLIEFNNFYQNKIILSKDYSMEGKHQS